MQLTPEQMTEMEAALALSKETRRAVVVEMSPTQTYMVSWKKSTASLRWLKNDPPPE